MNDLLIYGIVLLGGIAIGVVVTIVITRVYKPYYRQDVLSIGGEIQKNLAAFTDAAAQSAVDHMVKMSGQVISSQAQLSEQNLEGKKALIDQSIKEVRDNLKSLSDLVTDLEKNRAQAYGDLTAQLKTASEQTLRLSETTGKLQAALGNSRVRGQWGERMADDILRSIGFVEGTNYHKQQVDQSSGSRPDYTFLLPNRLVLNMDVKFPLDNYMQYINTESEADREAFKGAFLKDARQRIQEVTGRDYISPEQNTVDYVLVLIPNEQVYHFINENDPTLLDDALKLKVVLCSPVTLYAVLALINQAVKNFRMDKAINEILQLISSFLLQWQKYAEGMDKMGRKIGEAQKEFSTLQNTRKTMLEKPLLKIDQIRRERNIEELEVVEAEALPAEPSTLENDEETVP
jgi:DNA recombination protein RmuC